MDKPDRHGEARTVLNTMRGDYRDALLMGHEDDETYDALLATLIERHAAGDLPVPLLLKLVAFAARRLAIKQIEEKMTRAISFKLHTEN